MVINKNALSIYEDYKIKLQDSTLEKIEDAIRNKKELLLTIAASHYGFKNGNGVFYRHDTVAKDIPTFVSPLPRPIIEKHRPETSTVYGNVIAADYKVTRFYDHIAKTSKLENLTTEEYIELCKTVLYPFQKKTPNYEGLAYVEVVGKLNNKEGIKKVLDREFLTVSIGAGPRKLICSECGQDQVEKMCEHYPLKRTPHIFMLAESLEYEELSFVDTPADPFGKITRIHDGKVEEFKIEREDNWMDANVDVILLQDFFKQAEGKKIVCMDNICTIINQEEDPMAGKEKEEVKTSSLSLNDEFSAEQLQSITLTDEETLEALALTDEALTDKQFALIQKTADGIVRRFPVRNALDVKVGLQLVDSASDLTETEMVKVKASLGKAAKKFGIELIADAKEEEKVETVEDAKVETITDIDSAIEAIKEVAKAFEPELTDGVEEATEVKKNPVEKIFDLLKWFATDIKWASEGVTAGINGYLTDLGQTVLGRDELDQKDALVASLTDKVAELETEITSKDEEIDLLDKQNIDLNFQLRASLVDEIVALKDSLDLLTDSTEEEKAKLFKRPYDALVEQVNEYRKLTTKLKDSTVNNNIKINKIADPTLADSEDRSDKSEDLEDVAKLEDEKKEPTFEEKAKALQALFTFIRR